MLEMQYAMEVTLIGNIVKGFLVQMKMRCKIGILKILKHMKQNGCESMHLKCVKRCFTNRLCCCPNGVFESCCFK